MFRLLSALLLCILPGLARAEVTCAQMQAALKVPPPPSGRSEDPDGPLGCSRAALEMFALNKVAVQAAEPVTDLADLQGFWLGDLVLPYLLGVTVPGQEVLVLEPGEQPGTLKVTQYWMRALSLPNAPLWTEDGRYTGIAAEAELFLGSDGSFAANIYGDAVHYGTAMLEADRSYDLFVKSQLNHFELPFTLRRAEDVLVLEGSLRDPAKRDPQDYTRTYTRIAPGAAELALGIVLTFELSQARNMDCLAHQITAGKGPLFEVLGEGGLPELERFVRRSISEGMHRERLSRELRGVEDEDERARLLAEMREATQALAARMTDPGYRDMVTRIAEGSDSFCPDYF